jgi:hypothetical protein
MRREYHVELLSGTFGVALFCRRDSEPHEGIEAMAGPDRTIQCAVGRLMDRIPYCDLDGDLGIYTIGSMILHGAHRDKHFAARELRYTCPQVKKDEAAN